MCEHNRIRISFYIRNKKEGYIIQCITCKKVLKDCNNLTEVQEYIKNNNIRYIDSWIKGDLPNVGEKCSC